MTEPMNVLDAIYGRRAVRNYTSKKIDKDTIQALLKAAVQAPTAMHREAWAFAIIQDKDMLKRLSDTSKELIVKEARALQLESGGRSLDRFTNPDFNVFYNANTLIAIYGKPYGSFAVADCWLAAENLMLAAYSMGLGSCVIGLAVSALNSPEWKNELGIPSEMTSIAPVIVGEPAGETPVVARSEPEILAWKA